MDDMIEFLTSKEIVVVYIVVAVAFLLCFIIYLIDKNREKRKRRQNTRQLNKLVEDVNKKMRDEEKKSSLQPKNKEVVKPTPVENVQPTKKDVVSNLSNTDFVPDLTEYQGNNQRSSEQGIREVPQVVVEKRQYRTTMDKGDNVYPQAKSYDTRVDNSYSQNKSYDTRREESAYSQMRSYDTRVDNSYSQNKSYDIGREEKSYNPTRTYGSRVENNYNQKREYENQPIEHLEMEASNSIKKAMDSQINKLNDTIDELVYTDPEPNREEATRELIKLAEELEKAERKERNSSVLDVSKYETEQEENAIISLDELSKKSEEMYAANEVTQYADEGNEPISLEDLERRKMQVVNSEVNQPTYSVQTSSTVPSLKKSRKEELSFTSTGMHSENTGKSPAYQGGRIITQEVFSPIFGFDNNTMKNKTTEEIDEELQKTSEFLLSLKELKSKLNS